MPGTKRPHPDPDPTAACDPFVPFAPYPGALPRLEPAATYRPDPACPPHMLPVEQWAGRVALRTSRGTSGAVAEVAQEAVTLHVAHARVYLVHDEAGAVRALEYAAIGLHALQGEEVYAQIRTEDSNDDEEEIVEVWFRPEPGQAEPLYQALSLCGGMHPDPVAEEEDALEQFEDRFYTAKAFDLSEQGKENLARFEAMLGQPSPVPAAASAPTDRS